MQCFSNKRRSCKGWLGLIGIERASRVWISSRAPLDFGKAMKAATAWKIAECCTVGMYRCIRCSLSLVGQCNGGKEIQSSGLNTPAKKPGLAGRPGWSVWRTPSKRSVDVVISGINRDFLLLNVILPPNFTSAQKVAVSDQNGEVIRFDGLGR